MFQKKKGLLLVSSSKGKLVVVKESSTFYLVMDVHKFNTKVNLMICLVYEMLLLNVCPSQSFNKHKKYILTFEYLKSNYYVKNL